MGEQSILEEAWNKLELKLRAAMYFAASYEQRKDLAFRALARPDAVTIFRYPRKFLPPLVVFTVNDGKPEGTVFSMTEADFWLLYNQVDNILRFAEEEEEEKRRAERKKLIKRFGDHRVQISGTTFIGADNRAYLDSGFFRVERAEMARAEDEFILRRLGGSVAGND